MGGGWGVVFELGNPEGSGGGGGLKQFRKSQVEGRGSKNMPSIGGGGGGFFLDPFNIFLFHLRYKRNGKQLNVSYWVTEALHGFATYNISSHEAIT